METFYLFLIEKKSENRGWMTGSGCALCSEDFANLIIRSKALEGWGAFGWYCYADVCYLIGRQEVGGLRGNLASIGSRQVRPTWEQNPGFSSVLHVTVFFETNQLNSITFPTFHRNFKNLL